MAKTFFVLRVTPRDFAVRFNKLRAIYNNKSRELVNQVADFTVLTMKSFTPVATGRLRDSIQVKKKTTTGGTTDLRSTIEVGSPLNYFRFVDQGTASSPGRFVPAIGKRLITLNPSFGFHPGVKPHNIIDQTQAKVLRDTDVKLKKVLRSWGSKWEQEF